MQGEHEIVESFGLLFVFGIVSEGEICQFTCRFYIRARFPGIGTQVVFQVGAIIGSYKYATGGDGLELIP